MIASTHTCGRFPPPWVLKPRFEAGAVGIKKAYTREEAWRHIDELGDQQSFYLLEQFVPGDVYHVDALVEDSEIVFMRAQNTAARRSASLTREASSFPPPCPMIVPETERLHDLNRQLIAATRFVRGATHTEYHPRRRRPLLFSGNSFPSRRRQPGRYDCRLVKH